MRAAGIILLFGFFVSISNSCSKEASIKKSALIDIKKDTYFGSEIFSPDNQNIYGKWKLYKISGGFSGSGYEPDFDFLEIKGFGIYGFVKNSILLEYGKIVPASNDPNDTRLSIEFTPDENSNTFFNDRVKYVEISCDSMHLYAPCCDRYNYHFVKAE